jgi:hypothetical protein
LRRIRRLALETQLSAADLDMQPKQALLAAYDAIRETSASARSPRLKGQI